CLFSRRPRHCSLFPYTTLFRSLLVEGLAERLSRGRTGLVRIRGNTGGEEVLGEAVRPRLETLRKSVSRRSADQLRFVLDLRAVEDRKSTCLNSSHVKISYAVSC